MIPPAFAATPAPSDPLLQLELRIARRADQLVQQRGPGTDLDVWLEAERQVMDDRRRGPGSGGGREPGASLG